MWKTGRKISDKERKTMIEDSQADTSTKGRKITTALQVEARKVKQFSDATWGGSTRWHSLSTVNLTNRKWDQAVDGATSGDLNPTVDPGAVDEEERHMPMSEDEDLAGSDDE